MTDWLDADEVAAARKVRNEMLAGDGYSAGDPPGDMAKKIVRAIAALALPVDRIRTEKGFDEQVELERICLACRAAIGEGGEGVTDADKT